MKIKYKSTHTYIKYKEAHRNNFILVGFIKQNRNHYLKFESLLSKYLLCYLLIKLMHLEYNLCRDIYLVFIYSTMKNKTCK